MTIADLLQCAKASRVRITLSDGKSFTGRFRTDILSESAISAFFYGEERDLSLAIEDIVSVEALEAPAAPPDLRQGR